MRSIRSKTRRVSAAAGMVKASFMMGLGFLTLINVALAVTLREVDGEISVPHSNLHLQFSDWAFACAPKSMVAATSASEPGLFASCRRTPERRAEGFFQFDLGRISLGAPGFVTAISDLDYYITVVTQSGRVAGYTLDEFDTPNGYVWDSTTGALSIRAGSLDTWIFGANDSGTFFVGRGTNYAAYWNFPVRDSRFDYQYLIEGDGSADRDVFDQSGIALDVNESGNSVGIANWNRSSILHAFFKPSVGPILDIQADAGGELARLPRERYYETLATAINNSNYVVGYSYQKHYIADRREYGEIKPRAFWWRPNRRFATSGDFRSGEFHSLPKAHSKALAINHQCTALNGPVLVGYYLPQRADESDNRFYPGELETRYSGDTGEPYKVFHELTEGPDKSFAKHAFAYDLRSRQFLDLNEIVPLLVGADSERLGEWKLEVATGIDDQGRVIGYGMHGGERRGFLLNGVCDYLRSRQLQRSWREYWRAPSTLTLR